MLLFLIVPGCSPLVRPGPASLVPAGRGQPGQRLRALPWGGGSLRWSGLHKNEEEHIMALQVAALSIELIELLCPLVPRIRARDKSLADQLVRAANSIALNAAEAEGSDPGNRRARFFSASGSANETLMAVRVATAWRHLAPTEGAAAQVLLGRIIAMLWKLTRG